MATCTHHTMLALFGLVLFISASMVHGQSTGSGITKIRNRHAFIADPGTLQSFVHLCIDNANKYQIEIRESTSIETLIDLIERLEDVVANTSSLNQFNSPDKVARLLLQRFHLDSVDFKILEQDPRVGDSANIDTSIIGLMTTPTLDYDFPDYIYNNNELCTLLFSFSHIFLNNTYEFSRTKRETYKFQRSDPTQAVNSPYVDNNNNQNLVNPIQEKGVVSLRQDKSEAIAPARVLMGVIAGFTTSPVLSGKAIAGKLGFDQLQTEVNFKDHILAVTFGDLMGTAAFVESTSDKFYDPNYIFGAKGAWMNDTCCTYYAINGVSNARTLRRSNRASLAQIRGALDGYAIGKTLRELDGAQNLRLSSILKSYYSAPHISTSSARLGASYCDRRDNRPVTTDLTDTGNTYYTIYSQLYMKGFNYRGDTLIGKLDEASATQQEFCSKRPSGNLDRSSPCETPSDLIFIVDPKSEEKQRTAQFITEISSRINHIDRYGGTVSVFANSNSRVNNVELPSGPGGWPLAPLIFNSTNIGALACQITPNTPLVSQNNAGKYLYNVNQTIMNYKWWTPRRFSQGVPSKNVILIDYGSLELPTSGADKSDYDTYKEALKWRNRDIKYLVISPKPEIFKNFIVEDSDVVAPGAVTQTAQTFATKICENPSTLTPNECMQKTAQNATFEGFITPGYKQNWAMYPEYFKVSSSIEFTIKATEGSIKYCWDRKFPPENQLYCKDIQENSQESFKIWGPCDGHSVHTCQPIYITVWGKDRSTVCKDVACLSLDQVKFSIGSTGAYCNSALKLTSSFMLLQAICLVLIWLHMFK